MRKRLLIVAAFLLPLIPLVLMLGLALLIGRHTAHRASPLAT